jgi:hypothetical protein
MVALVPPKPVLSRVVAPADLSAADQRCQSCLQQFRGLAYVAGDRVGELSAAPAGADVTDPRVHVDLDQAGERPAGDRRLGIGRLGPLRGTLDQHFFAVQLRKFPDPDDAPKRKGRSG